MKILIAAGVALAALTFVEDASANTAASVQQRTQATSKSKPTAVDVIAAVDDAASGGDAAATSTSGKVSVSKPKSDAPAIKEAALPPAKKAKAKKRAAPTLVASVNLSSQRMTIKEYGKVKHVWKVSTGRSGYRTPTGTYTPKWMTRMHYSKQYDNAPMPHSVFFHRGYAVHATYETRRLGAPASHGCVRLSPANARKFYQLVSKHKRARTRISLRGVARDRKPTYAKKKKRRIKKRQVRRSYSGPSVGWNAQPQYSYGYSSQRVFPGDRPRRRIKPRYR